MHCIMGHSSVNWYVTQWGAGITFPEIKLNECVRFNVINVTRGCVTVKFPGKSITQLERPLKFSLQPGIRLRIILLPRNVA